MRQAMALMRHGDARLTMQVYADQGLLDVGQEVGKLPWIAGKSGSSAGSGTDTAASSTRKGPRLVDVTPYPASAEERT